MRRPWLGLGRSATAKKKLLLHSNYRTFVWRAREKWKIGNESVVWTQLCYTLPDSNKMLRSMSSPNTILRQVPTPFNPFPLIQSVDWHTRCRVRLKAQVALVIFWVHHFCSSNISIHEMGIYPKLSPLPILTEKCENGRAILGTNFKQGY
jgi:hypothetical protein